ncbi:vWA domain-containing protein [Halomicrobium salinisoli]|uniref:vWA domain-containing protein n=1 Tax=Halomicrobium salinisoli TaxID=2878391 RepID=UPI001CF0A8FD|nr:vWA domain-containing protein [Halomicrobium salinisoli]
MAAEWLQPLSVGRLPPLAADVSVAGTRIGAERPLLLAGVPVALLLVGLLVLRPTATADPDRQRRLALACSRGLVATLLVVAMAGPYTAATETVQTEPRVTLLVDRSDSTAVSDASAGDLAAGIEDHGVEVTTRTVAEGGASPVGDGVTAALAPNATLLLLSDGRVTEGRSLGEAAELADRVDATISAVSLSADETERYVAVSGPDTVSSGVENRFLVRVDGANVAGETNLTVTVDGEKVASRTVRNATAVRVAHEFDEVGDHRITARIDGDDAVDRNDVARATVRVVEPPRILYVARGDYPAEGFLRELYRVDRAESVPSDLSGYYAVVVQDVPADELGDTAALQRAVANGTGLVTVGGPNSFERGGYYDDVVGDALPVTGEEGRDQSDVVLAVDTSGSAAEGLSVQQSLALDALDQLGDDNRVGVVAFDEQAYRIAGLTPLGGNREDLRGRIRRLETDGGTRIAAGLSGAGRLLDGGGTVVLLSDGRDNGGGAVAAANELSDDGTRVVAVNVGRFRNETAMRRIAAAGDGQFLRADETDRLRLRFGGEDRRYSGDGLTVVDGTHFVTEGVTLEASPGNANDVSVRERADYLAATGSGAPAVSAWRYGLGRSVAITAYSADGGLGGLLSPPDSVLVTKSVNWAVGDPQRLADDVAMAPDARVGERVAITYRGDRRPESEDHRFVRVGDGEYRATAVPTEAGFHEAAGAAYAVDYAREYGGFGQSDAVENAVETTGGELFEPSETAAIADHAVDRAVRERVVRTDYAWAALAAALVVFLIEVAARRIRTIRARRQP